MDSPPEPPGSEADDDGPVQLTSRDLDELLGPLSEDAGRYWNDRLFFAWVGGFVDYDTVLFNADLPPRDFSSGVSGNPNRVSAQRLDARLACEGCSEAPEWWNDRLKHANRLGVLTPDELQASLSKSTRCVKRYLWSLTEDSLVRQRLRSYSIACSKLLVRAFSILNLCAAEAMSLPEGERGGAIEDLSDLLHNIGAGGPLRNVKALFLPRDADRLPPFVRSVAARHRDLLDAFLPDEADVRLVCDNSKTYMAGDVSVAVRNHVKVHFLRRVKASLPVRDRKGASDALHGADVALDEADALAVRLATERLASCGVRLERASGELAFAGDHVSSEALRWHLEMCKAPSRGSFQAFPLSDCTSRRYARVDSVIYSNMFKDSAVGFREALGLDAGAWNRRRKKRRCDGTKPNKRLSLVGKLRDGETVTSVMTDGVGVSVVVSSPHVRKASSLGPKEAFEARLARLKGLFEGNPGALVGGADPGRIVPLMLHVRGARQAREEGVRVAYSRARWQKDTGQADNRLWEAKRRSRPWVKAALDALSESGGKRGCDLASFVSYLEAARDNREVLWKEFLLSDERARRKMTAFRAKQRALDRVATRAATSGDRSQPLIVGYGNASFKCHGRGSSDTPVPIKGMYTALVRAFRRCGRRGGVIKVWEAYTTKMCSRCHEELDLVYEMDIAAKQPFKPCHDFRSCSNCLWKEEPKLRNRDYNAAVNIWTVTVALLGGEERPSFLCPDQSRRRPSNRRG